MFIEGTKILMKKGVKKIEYLTLSDKVLCIDKYSGYDDEYDNIDNINVTSHNVQSIQTVEHDELYYINNDKLRLLESEYIFIKRNNKYLWKQVEKLLLGDYLIDYKKREIKITSIIPVKLKKKQLFFHVLVHEKGKHNKHYNTYFANGFLVHNAGSFAGGPCSSIPELTSISATYRTEKLRYRTSLDGPIYGTTQSSARNNTWKDFRTELTVRQYNWRPAWWTYTTQNDPGRYDTNSSSYGKAGAWNTYFGTTPTRFMNWFSRFDPSHRSNKNNLEHITPNGKRVFVDPATSSVNENSGPVRLGMHSLDGLSTDDEPSNKSNKGSVDESRFWSNDFVNNQDGNTTLKTYDLYTDYTVNNATRKMVNKAFEVSSTDNEYDGDTVNGIIPGNVSGRTGRIIIKYYSGASYQSDIVLKDYYANLVWHNFCDQSTGNATNGASFEGVWKQSSAYANTDTDAKYGPTDDSTAWVDISATDTWNGRWCKLNASTNTPSTDTGGISSVNSLKTIYFEASGTYSRVVFLRSGLIKFTDRRIIVRLWHDGINMGNLWVGVDLSSEFENWNNYSESLRHLGHSDFDWKTSNISTKWGRLEDGIGQNPEEPSYFDQNDIDIGRSIAISQMDDLQPCSECGAGLMNVINIAGTSGSEKVYGYTDNDDGQNFWYPYSNSRDGTIERKQWYHLRTAYGITFKAQDDIRLLAVGLKAFNSTAASNTSFTHNSNNCVLFYIHSLYRPGTEENNYPQIDDWSSGGGRRKIIGMGQIIVPSYTTNGSSYTTLWGWSNMDGAYTLSGYNPSTNSVTAWDGSNIPTSSSAYPGGPLSGNNNAYSYKANYRPTWSPGYNNGQNTRLAMGRIGYTYNVWNAGPIYKFHSSSYWRAGSLFSYINQHPNGPTTGSRFSDADIALGATNGQGNLVTTLLPQTSTDSINNWRGLYGDYPTWQYYMGETGNAPSRTFRSGQSTSLWLPKFANEWNNRGVILKKGGEYSIIFGNTLNPSFQVDLLPVERKYSSGSQYTCSMDGNGNYIATRGDSATSGRIKTGQYILGGAALSDGSYDDYKPSHPKNIQYSNIAMEYKYRNSPWGVSTPPTSTNGGPNVSSYASIQRTEISWRGTDHNPVFLGGYNPRLLPNGEFKQTNDSDSTAYPGALYYSRAPMISLQTQRIG